MDNKELLEKLFGILKSLLELIGLGDLIAKGEAEFDKIMSNVKPL